MLHYRAVEYRISRLRVRRVRNNSRAIIVAVRQHWSHPRRPGQGAGAAANARDSLAGEHKGNKMGTVNMVLLLLAVVLSVFVGFAWMAYCFRYSVLWSCGSCLPCRECGEAVAAAPAALAPPPPPSTSSNSSSSLWAQRTTTARTRCSSWRCSCLW